jgi:hypothetical protein
MSLRKRGLRNELRVARMVADAVLADPTATDDDRDEAQAVLAEGRTLWELVGRLNPVDLRDQVKPRLDKLMEGTVRPMARRVLDSEASAMRHLNRRADTAAAKSRTPAAPRPAVIPELARFVTVVNGTAYVSPKPLANVSTPNRRPPRQEKPL